MAVFEWTDNHCWLCVLSSDVYLEQNSHGPFGPFALALTDLPRSCPAMQYINANHFKLGLDALHLPNYLPLNSDIVN